MIALSIGKLKTNEGGTTTTNDGRIYHFAYVKDIWRFRVGLALNFLGFCLQLKK